MHIAHPHKQDKIEPDSGDSEYDTQPGDIGLPEPILSSAGPMTQSQTSAHWLALSIWEAGTKAVQYVQVK